MIKAHLHTHRLWSPCASRCRSLTSQPSAKGHSMSMAVEVRKPYKNRILASLPKAEISRLAPHLSPLNLPIGTTLLDPGEEFVFAYFLDSVLASVVVTMADGMTVETGITGNEGVVGITVPLCTISILTRSIIQIAG